MPSLTRAEAQRRADLLTVTSYVVDLDLTGGDDESVTTYSSLTRVRFTCSQPGQSSFADLKASAVTAMRLNGRPLPVDAWVDGRLELTDLAADNVLVVEADMPWRRDGQGLHRAFDPADGRAYVYGHFFLDAAPTVAVCFDQPDLKAPWTITVTTPPEWTVIGNGTASSPEPNRFELSTTQPLATYFVTICAGPYVSVLGEHRGIPLGVHTRASLRTELERVAPELLANTGRFFDAFHELFAIDYPFGGYDQVFVPEFNALAMENPGCVTLRDELLFRGAATPDQILERDNTMAHEMAHMWFGDLVTMQWWDDLWLNESFAEYLSHRVLVATGLHPDAWVSATMARRPWGYAAERSPSTHPITGGAALDAEAALQDFDGISYAKGAAALRQLIEFVGDDAFVAGVRDHLTRHAFGNATMADFLGSVGAAAGRDLDPWRDAWLLTAGRDTLAAELADGALTVRRTRPVAGQVPAQVDPQADRPHATDVAGYTGGRQVFRVPVVIGQDELSVPLPEPVPDRPALVVPNASDLTWAAVDLDPATLAALPGELPLLPDAQVRASVWVAVWDSVARAQMPAAAYLELFCAAWPREDDASILFRVANTLPRAVRDFLDEPARSAMAQRLATVTTEALRGAQPGSARSIAMARVSAAWSTDWRLLREWSMGLGMPQGLHGDSDFRWAAMETLCRRGHAGPDDLDKVEATDQTLQGRLNALRARASMPDEAAKQWAWQEMTDPQAGHSNYELAYLAEGFWRFEDVAVVEPYVERYFTEVPAMQAWVGQDALARFAKVAFPTVVDERTEQLSGAALARTDLSAAVRRAMVDGDWRLQEALQARRRFGSPAQ